MLDALPRELFALVASLLGLADRARLARISQRCRTHMHGLFPAQVERPLCRAVTAYASEGHPLDLRCQRASLVLLRAQGCADDRGRLYFEARSWWGCGQAGQAFEFVARAAYRREGSDVWALFDAVGLFLVCTPCRAPCVP